MTDQIRGDEWWTNLSLPLTYCSYCFWCPGSETPTLTTETFMSKSGSYVNLWVTNWISWSLNEDKNKCGGNVDLISGFSVCKNNKSTN